MAWWNNNAAPNAAPPAANAAVAQPAMQPNMQRMMQLLNEMRQARLTASVLPRGNAQRRQLMRRARALEQEAAWHAAHGSANIGRAHANFFRNQEIPQQNENEDPQGAPANAGNNGAAGNPQGHARRRRGGSRKNRRRNSRKTRRN